jgi:hypothetical protein
MPSCAIKRAELCWCAWQSIHGDVTRQATMKNILVLAGGADSDEAVFVTALAAARPLRAHLEFCHLQVDPGEAAGCRRYLCWILFSAVSD